MKYLKRTDSTDIFIFLSLLITITFIVANLVSGGYVFKNLCLSDSFLFSDYFYHIGGASDTADMYSLGDPFSFPAFTYFLYSFLWSFVPYHDDKSIANYAGYMSNGNALVVFVVYNMVCMIFLLYIIGQYCRKNGFKSSIVLPLALVFSYPLMCTSIQRGNSVLPVALMIALALLWMDDESAVKQEAALILIAFSAGFKMYPAILGLFYIKRKDWKKVIRLIIYGLAVFFLPFLIFGGFEGLGQLIHTWTGFVSTGDYEKTNTIWGLVKYIVIKLHGSEAMADILGPVVQNIFLVICVACFFFSRKKWQETLLLTGVLASYLPSNWQYTICYYLAALLLYLTENPQRPGKMIGWVHIVIFALIFSMDWLMVYFRYGVTTGFFLLTYILLGISMADSIVGFFGKKKQRS